jgi:hypothetical protein
VWKRTGLLLLPLLLLLLLLLSWTFSHSMCVVWG